MRLSTTSPKKLHRPTTPDAVSMKFKKIKVASFIDAQIFFFYYYSHKTDLCNINIQYYTLYDR